MAYAPNNYTASGAQTDFTITWLFLANADVKVYEDGVLQVEDTDYTLESSGTIMRLVTPAVGGEAISIQRDTDVSTISPVFANDTGFPAATLNELVQRCLYALEEQQYESGVSVAGTTGQVQVNAGFILGAISEGTSGQVLTSAGVGVPATFEDVPAQAGGSQYETQVAGTSGAFLGVAVGDAGDVLTSGGAGAYPTFEDPSAAASATAGMQLLQADTIGAGSITQLEVGAWHASAGFPALVSYDMIVCEFNGLIHNPGSSTFGFQIMNDKGVAMTTANYYLCGEDRIASVGGVSVTDMFDYGTTIMTPFNLHLGSISASSRGALSGRITMRYPWANPQRYGGTFEFWKYRDSGTNNGAQHCSGTWHYDALVSGGQPGGFMLSTPSGAWVGSAGSTRVYGMRLA